MAYGFDLFTKVQTPDTVTLNSDIKGLENPESIDFISCYQVTLVLLPNVPFSRFESFALPFADDLGILFFRLLDGGEVLWLS